MNKKYRKNADKVIEVAFIVLFIGTWVIGTGLITTMLSHIMNYFLLKIIITIFCIIYCVCLYIRGMYIITGIFVVFLVMYNPIIPFHFYRHIWRVINIAMILVLISSIMYEWKLYEGHIKWKKQNIK